MGDVSELKKANFTVAAEASNGTEAVERFKEHSPDVVVMDYSMPDTTGQDVAKLLLGHNPQAIIVMVTSLNLPDLRENLLAMGVKGVFGKPHSAQELIAFITEEFSKSSAR